MYGEIHKAFLERPQCWVARLSRPSFMYIYLPIPNLLRPQENTLFMKSASDWIGQYNLHDYSQINICAPHCCVVAEQQSTPSHMEPWGNCIPSGPLRLPPPKRDGCQPTSGQIDCHVINHTVPGLIIDCWAHTHTHPPHMCAGCRPHATTGRIARFCVSRFRSRRSHVPTSIQYKDFYGWVYTVDNK